MKEFFQRKTGSTIYRWSPMPHKMKKRTRRVITPSDDTCVETGCYLATINDETVLVDYTTDYVYDLEGCHRIAYVSCGYTL